MGNSPERKLGNNEALVIALSIIAQNPRDYALHHPLCENKQVKEMVQKLLAEIPSNSQE